MQDLAERVEELQTRVETLESEKRDAQTVQERLLTDIRRLQQDQRSASSLSTPSPPLPVSPAASASALPPHMQRSGIPTAVQSPPPPIQSPATRGSVFDLNQPPPMQSAPPKPRPSSSPAPPQPQGSPIMSSQPQMYVYCLFSPSLLLTHVLKCLYGPTWCADVYSRSKFWQCAIRIPNGNAAANGANGYHGAELERRCADADLCAPILPDAEAIDVSYVLYSINKGRDSPVVVYDQRMLMWGFTPEGKRGSKCRQQARRCRQQDLRR